MASSSSASPSATRACYPNPALKDTEQRTRGASLWPPPGSPCIAPAASAGRAVSDRRARGAVSCARPADPLPAPQPDGAGALGLRPGPGRLAALRVTGRVGSAREGVAAIGGLGAPGQSRLAGLSPGGGRPLLRGCPRPESNWRAFRDRRSRLLSSLGAPGQSRTGGPFAVGGVGCSLASVWVPQARVELATFRLGGGCSIH